MVRTAAVLCLACILGGSFSAKGIGGSGADVARPSPTKNWISPSPARVLPLAFEANAGQMDPRARFVARTGTYSLFLTANEAVILRDGDVVRMRFPGSSPRARIVPVDLLPGRTNYIIGRDSSRWRTGVANYAKVRYEQIYPGIDLVFYGTDRQLEYDLVVHPGADPGRVRLEVDGARDLKVGSDGDLTGRTRSGEIRFLEPVIYQATADGGRHRIEGRYRQIGKRRVGFEVDTYDRSKPLVIDPVVVYATYLGGSDRDVTAGALSGSGGRQMLAVDATGAAYVTGTTDSMDFPTTAGSFQPSRPQPTTTVFVTKIAPDGASLVYSTFIGGTLPASDGALWSLAGGIAVDAAGNSYVVGNANAGNFPASHTPFAPWRDRNMFLLKLNPTGSALVYSVLFGAGQDGVTGVAIDPLGNAYVTGITDGSLSMTNVVPPDALQAQCLCFGSPGRFSDAFVVKFNPSATAVVYGTYLGGFGREEGTAIAVNGAGEAYVTGRTWGDFPIVNAAQPTYGGGLYDVFVSKLNASGSALVFSTYLGGSEAEIRDMAVSSIALDPAGNAYLTGYTDSGDFPTTPGAFQYDAPLGVGSGRRAYAAKYTPSGQKTYATFLSGNGGAIGTSVAADALGRVYLAGGTGSTDFPIVDATQPFLAGGAGGNDAYVTVLDATGSTALFSTYLGGPMGYDFATGIALGPNGSILVAGQTEGLGSFPTTAGAVQPGYGGGTDAFVVRIDIGPPPDTTAPVITSAGPSEAVLWPPNHKMRPITIAVNATDAGDSAPVCSIASVSSNEPVNGLGDGDTAPDWTVTGPLSLELRAERAGNGSGRIYSIAVSCTDRSGNVSAPTVVMVTVPHNK